MARYLISFDEGAMTFSEEDLPEVDGAAHAVVREAMDAGVWVFGGGLYTDEALSVVAIDGTVTDAPYPESRPLNARSTSSSGCDAPSRKLKFEWQCSSA